jgi:hypothetical protein
MIQNLPSEIYSPIFGSVSQTLRQHSTFDRTPQGKGYKDLKIQLAVIMLVPVHVVSLPTVRTKREEAEDSLLVLQGHSLGTKFRDGFLEVMS